MSSVSYQTQISGEDAWLWVALASGIGPASCAKILREYGDFHTFLRALEGGGGRVQEKWRQAIFHEETRQRVEQARDWLRKSDDHHLIYLDDDDYPPMLRESPSPPPLLFAKGQRSVLCCPMVTMVGGRHASQQGLDIARTLAAGLAQHGIVVVSGLAYGIDAASHQGALSVQGMTLAVVGTGVDRVYPAAHRDLAHQIVVSGLMLSEFPLGTPPLANHFPRRNRIIAGLAHACVVVEARLGSGSLITAQEALEANREVMAVPGSISSPYSKGCHHLIKQGTSLVEHVDDILLGMGFRVSSPPVHKTETNSIEGSTSHPYQDFLDQMSYDVVDLDQLIARGVHSPAEWFAALLELELLGDVVQLPGGRYQRTVRTLIGEEQSG